jgi:hypothetical protein
MWLVAQAIETDKESGQKTKMAVKRYQKKGLSKAVQFHRFYQKKIYIYAKVHFRLEEV